MATLYYDVPVVIASNLAHAEAVVPFQPPGFVENKRCYLTVTDWAWQPAEFPGFNAGGAVTVPFLQFSLDCNLPQGQSQCCRFTNGALSMGQRNVPLGLFRVYRNHRDTTDATRDILSNVESISSGPLEVYIPSGLQQIRFTVRPSLNQPAVAMSALDGHLSVQLRLTTLD